MVKLSFVVGHINLIVVAPKIYLHLERIVGSVLCGPFKLCSS